MKQNIFQVISETHLDEILDNHIRDLVVVMLSSQTCAPCKMIKPKFVELSKQHKDMFFIYIDRSNYKVTENKYFTEFEYTPTFVFYFGGQKIAFVEGGHEPSLIRAIMTLKQKIEDKRHEIEEQEKTLAEEKMKELEELNLQKLNNPPPQITQEQKNIPPPPQITQELILLNKKMELLQKLRDLTSNGIKLTQNYNLDSPIEELLAEYQLHMNSQKPQQIELLQLRQEQNNNEKIKELSEQDLTKLQKEELAKKQDQVRQIKELDMLNQRMQAQSFQKLQQLRRIQQMKEQQEKNNGKH
jgi:thiol-disulfide isomerase/thioredoxin